MAEKTDFRIRSTDGKTDLHAVRFMPEDGECRAVLQIVHGMDEYIGRYDDFAAFCADSGFMVVGHDHLGHGDSVTGPADLGYFSDGRGDITLTEDMHKLRLHISSEEKAKELPYFILGHSMGSFLLREYLASYSQGLAGAIIMGTGDVPAFQADMGILLCKVMARLKGWRYRSMMIQNLTYTKAYKQFDVTGKDLARSWLTKKTEVVEKYRNDPKCTFLFTLNGHRALFESAKAAGDAGTIDAMPKELPLLLVSGACDPVGDLGEGVRRVYNKLLAADMRDVSMKLYENDRHEILNETDSENVYVDILRWLNEKTTRQEKPEN